jgi:hypothetical protein
MEAQAERAAQEPQVLLVQLQSQVEVLAQLMAELWY